MLVSRTRLFEGRYGNHNQKMHGESAWGAFHHARTCGGETKKLIAVKLAVLIA
jgi:hypothetical protein